MSQRTDNLTSTNGAPGPAPRRTGLPEGWPVLALFGGFPIPSNVQFRLTAKVRDLQGAEGSDWQVTPPGDL